MADARFGVSDKQIAGLSLGKAAGFKPAAGQDYTSLAYGAGNQVVDARAIRFQGR